MELTEEGIEEYVGNYNYYLEKKNEVVIEEDDNYKTKTQIKLERKKERKKLEAMKKKRKKIIKLEKLIEQKEKDMDEIDRLLCDPNIYDKPEKVIELTKKRETLEIKINSLYEQWIKLTEE